MKPLFAIALCLGLTAFNAGADEDSAMTTSADGSHYSNARFGLSVTKPEGWYAMDIKESLAQMQQGSTKVAGSDQNIQAMFDAALQGTLPLFDFFQVPPGEAVRTNASISASAESVEAFPGIKTGCDYLSQMQKTMSRLQQKIDFPEGCRNAHLNGNPFGVMSTTMKVGIASVDLQYFACLKGRHALVFLTSYVDEKGAQSLAGVMRTMKLHCDA
ncbi:MAG: hypothetical protein ABWY06_01890 [Pseudomonas sp.]|uniref:hypothetical protein n=1 Tax=Pseudomonas sp. TaxID=306 RepID=UPI0033939020